MKSKKAIIITAVIFVLVAVVFAACSKKGTEPIVVTDANGVPITDVDGEIITVIPETEIYPVTDENGETKVDKNGNVETKVYYIPQDVQIPLTNAAGEALRDENGNVLTTVIIVPNETTTGIVINVPVTNEKGETQTDSSGSLVTETTIPYIPPNDDNSSISISTGFGGSGVDEFVAVVPTSDGGFIAALRTTSKDGTLASLWDTKLNAGAIVKFTKTGHQEWFRSFGGNGSVNINDICVDKDGNIYIVGETKSKDFTSLHGSEYDGFLMKYDADGNRAFLKGYGGTSNESFFGVDVDSDGSVYCVGFAYSADGDPESMNIPAGQSRAIIVRYDSKGNIQDQKGYGGFGDYFNAIDISSSNDIYVCGSFSSGTTIKPLGKADAGVFKFKKDLTYTFATRFGGTNSEYFPVILATSDGGCVIAGDSQSDDGDLKTVGNKGIRDAVIAKFNSKGANVWVNTFKGNKDERFTGVVENDSGQLFATGYSESATRDFRTMGNYGGYDSFVARYDASGQLMSSQGFGGSGNDMFKASCILKSGQIVGVGSTCSVDGYMASITPKSDGVNSTAMVLSFR
ncbi:MAG: SBBP repeat-containing protein [Clostridiales bacterium]|nr:SBBP repeat-containing protein [Clostridiales bacterium]